MWLLKIFVVQNYIFDFKIRRNSCIKAVFCKCIEQVKNYLYSIYAPDPFSFWCSTEFYLIYFSLVKSLINFRNPLLIQFNLIS